MSKKPSAPSLQSILGRKYLNPSERKRFHGAAATTPTAIRLFCEVILWTGCRISEALALAPASIDVDGGVLVFETLKRRARGLFREVPAPPRLIQDLDAHFQLRLRQADPSLANRRLWNWSRVTAWRHVKKVMKSANIAGMQAMPKGLRHAFGVVAFERVPPHLVQRWLGHASLRTTAIYGQVSGEEERKLAERIWTTMI